jgi:hypothetical protein
MNPAQIPRRSGSPGAAPVRSLARWTVHRFAAPVAALFAIQAESPRPPSGTSVSGLAFSLGILSGFGGLVSLHFFQAEFVGDDQVCTP